MDIESETGRIQAFVEKKNFHAALNLALSGMNACHRRGDQSGVDHFLGVIKGIADILEQEYGGES